MKIRFRMEGGIAFFPGLARPVTVDSDSLPPGEAAQLRALVDAAGLFELPAAVPPAAGAPPARGADRREYSIEVEDGDRRHAVRISDPVGAPALSELVRYLRGKASGP